MDPLYLQTGIPKFSKYIFYLNINIAHETLNQITPLAIRSLLDFQIISHRYNTRNNERKLLERPRTKTLKYGLKSIRYQVILNWNQLLLHSKQDLTSSSKSNLKLLVSNFMD